MLDQGGTVKVKHCITCNIIRPPWCSHCQYCDSCVMWFDHHCPWIGTCIGKWNYTYFVVFVASLSIGCIYSLVCTVVHVYLLVDELMADYSFWWACLESLKHSPLSSLLIVVPGLFSLFLTLLIVYHLKIACWNMTTHEDLKPIEDRVFHPYTEGCWSGIRK